MRIRIVDINFVKSMTTLEVTADLSEASRIYLLSFVSKCRALGLKDIRLYYPPDTPENAASRLKKFCSNEHMSPPRPTPSDIDLRLAVQSGRLPQAHPCSGASFLSEYQVSFNDLDKVVNDLTTTVILISDTADLDPRSLFKLRLSLYELVVNTVEHGTFRVDSPEITVRLMFAEERVSVSYADNATVFMADNTSAVDMVEEQIKSSSKRGLGLYLLNNVCDDWKYKRVDDWNITTFGLEISRDTTPANER